MLLPEHLFFVLEEDGLENQSEEKEKRNPMLEGVPPINGCHSMASTKYPFELSPNVGFREEWRKAQCQAQKQDQLPVIDELTHAAESTV